MVGYTNEKNPFGDRDLGKKFTWKKNKKESVESEKRILAEIEKVRERRSARESEVAAQERMRELEARKTAAAEEDWEAKEEAFHLRQTKVRSRLRLGAGRAKPVDRVAQNILLLEEDLSGVDAELRSPRDILAGLSAADLREFRDDARPYVSADPARESFWRATLAVADYELELAERRDRGEAERGSVHAAVAADLAASFADKSIENLEDASRQIEARRRDAQGADREYWDHAAAECEFAAAAKTLESAHADILERLGNQRRTTTEKKKKPVASTLAKPEADDSPAAAAMVEREQDKLCADDEDLFTAEVPLPPRPNRRKPRYVNRVKTGYEWNKYNQTHYTPEEPPPKIVQGYRFNIFYPDLHRDQKAPTYVLEQWTDPAESNDRNAFCVIKFVSPGAPYDDLAFKIVNQEWEHGHRRGFKCVFDRGVLHLHFNFKRWRYRR
ncbi:hypothetical protein CTAYLR_003668 [Chrysophaeum taylorii]|uniref:Splicing factor Cactin n=1 Tax=Chrysophaeum taylorii TaxID=2483200 RepID=A0AAD7UEQ5_9STRA|nr:hypothetical protein CTAYLR_003668 [Chrysophaeum taylorii]